MTDVRPRPRQNNGKLLLGLAACTLSACATTQARLHSQDELNLVGLRCGVALGELFQDESEKRLVFLFKPGATAEQRACIAGWAKKNKLRTVFVDAIAFPDEG